MEHMTILFQTILYSCGEFCIALFELLALSLIFYAGVIGFINFCRKSENTSLDLLRGFSIGLSFLLGAEILKTVIVLHDLSELIIVGGLVAIRVGISILIHWEMVQEKKEREMELEEEHHKRNLEKESKED